LKDVTFSAGTAFAVELEEENVSLVLTAYHLFGESGGLDEQIPASVLPDVFEKVVFTDAYNDSECGECEKILKLRMLIHIRKLIKISLLFIMVRILMPTG